MTYFRHWFAAIAVASLWSSAATAQSVMESQKYPVSVHYAPGNEVFAQEVLAAVEDAWSFQVEEQGFLQPPADAGLNGSDDFDVLIEATAYQAYVTAVAPAADRPLGWTTQMVLDPGLPSFALPLVISHEFHHAIQAGVCTFGANFSEAGAVYVSGIHRRGESRNLSYFLGFNAFQGAPERSLDWQGSLGDFYPYGSALFFIYLDDASPTGAELGTYKKLLAAMYEETKNATECPYYLDTLGQLVDVDAAYTEFARWRYFVGPQADAHHFKDLANWSGSGETEQLESVALEREIEPSTLPIVDAEPAAPPMPLGATYVRLSLVGSDRPARLRLSFQGETAVKWSLQTMLTSAGAEPVERGVSVAADGAANLTISSGDATALVVSFVNLGNGLHTDDGSDWTPAGFRYSLSAIPAPSLSAVAPAVLTVGQPITAEISGTDFPDGVPEITFSSAQISATNVTRLSAELVRADLLAAPGTELGPAAMTLTWSSLETAATLPDALTIIAPQQSRDDGGDCSFGRSSSRKTSLFAWLLLLVAVARARVASEETQS